MTENIYVYLAVMASVTSTIRALLLILIHRQITNWFLRSFLYYMPYMTLAVMTFLAILDAIQMPVPGVLTLVVGVALAWRGASLFKVSASCYVVVFLVGLLMRV